MVCVELQRNQQQFVNVRATTHYIVIIQLLCVVLCGGICKSKSIFLFIHLISAFLFVFAIIFHMVVADAAAAAVFS